MVHALEAGQSATVPAGTPHAFGNRSEVMVRFLKTSIAWLCASRDTPGPYTVFPRPEEKGGFDVRALYACTLIKEYGDTMQPAGGMQRAVIGGLAALSRPLGYEAYYPMYRSLRPLGSEEESTGVASGARMVSAVAAIFAILVLVFLPWWVRRLGRK